MLLCSRHGNTSQMTFLIHSCHWHATWWSYLLVDSCSNISLITSYLIHRCGSIHPLTSVSLHHMLLYNSSLAIVVLLIGRFNTNPDVNPNLNTNPKFPDWSTTTLQCRDRCSVTSFLYVIAELRQTGSQLSVNLCKCMWSIWWCHVSRSDK